MLKNNYIYYKIISIDGFKIYLLNYNIIQNTKHVFKTNLKIDRKFELIYQLMDPLIL